MTAMVGQRWRGVVGILLTAAVAGVCGAVWYARRVWFELVG